VFLQTGVAALASLAGLFLVMSGDSCGSGGVECNNTVIMLGALFGMASPWVLLGLTILVCLHRLKRRQSAWWVPVLGAPLTVALLFVAYFVTTLGVG
jgi:hypothetical protein